MLHKPQVQEMWKIKNIPRHIIIKLFEASDKDKTLKEDREKRETK